MSVPRLALSTRIAKYLNTSKLVNQGFCVKCLMFIQLNCFRDYSCRLGTENTCISKSNNGTSTVYMDVGSMSFLDIPAWLQDKFADNSCQRLHLLRQDNRLPLVELGIQPKMDLEASKSHFALPNHSSRMCLKPVPVVKRIPRAT